jgi:hypothetical protein
MEPEGSRAVHSERPDFWRFYLSEHSRPNTRRLHFAGTSLALACLLWAIITGRGLLVLVGLALGYAFAWSGHFFVEKNRPATFRYPLRSFAADLKMWALMLTGRLEAEIRRLEIR